jgi:hypothetical protein
MHLKRFIAAAAVVGAIVAGSGTAQAITGNWMKDDEHPFVGLAAFYDANGEFIWRCSGSLLDENTFLTAGHCTDEPAASVRIWFQQDAGAHYDPVTQHDPVSGYPDSCAPGTEGTLCFTSHSVHNYGFDEFAGFPNTHDAGVVVLDQPASMPEYGHLAAPGTLDALATQKGRQDVTVLASGYGLSYSSPVSVTSFRERLMGYGHVINLTSANNGGFNLQTNGNGAGRGGTCSGDSGGPIFYPADSNQIVAVTSFGLNSWCRGVDFSYRVDRADVQAWIFSFG